LSYSPEQGVSGLPGESQGKFYSIAYFYHSIGVMIAVGVLDERRLIWIMHHRISKVWTAIEISSASDAGWGPGSEAAAGCAGSRLGVRRRPGGSVSTDRRSSGQPGFGQRRRSPVA
jgi:hypothetical protein